MSLTAFTRCLSGGMAGLRVLHGRSVRTPLTLTSGSTSVRRWQKSTQVPTSKVALQILKYQNLIFYFLYLQHFLRILNMYSFENFCRKIYDIIPARVYGFFFSLLFFSCQETLRTFRTLWILSKVLVSRKWRMMKCITSIGQRMVGFSLTLFSLFSVLEIVQEMEIVQTVTLWKERREGNCKSSRGCLWRERQL